MPNLAKHLFLILQIHSLSLGTKEVLVELRQMGDIISYNKSLSCPFQDEDGHLPNVGRDKAEVCKAFFASVFSMDDGPRGSQCPELEDHENDQLPVDPETVRDLLLQLDPYKSMGPDGIHPRILKELLMSSHNLS